MSEEHLQLLLKRLKHKRIYKRMEAIRELAQIADERAVPGLIECLSDASKSGTEQVERVCDAAGIALAKIATPEALEAVQQWRADPFPFFRKALDSYHDSYEIPAIRAISQLEGDRVIDALMYAMGGYSFNAFHYAKDEIIKKGKQAIPKLLEYLHGDNAYRRGNAAVILGKIGNPAVVPDLISTLNDPKADVRAYAAEALGNIGDIRAIESLKNLLSDITQVDYYLKFRVCDKAIEALQKINSPEAVAVVEQWYADPTVLLVRGLQKSRQSVRRKLAWSLHNSDNEKNVATLIAALDDEDQEVQRGAAWSLGKLEDLEAVPALLSKLKTSTPYVKATVIQVLGMLKDARAIQPLIEQLSNLEFYWQNNRICWAAHDALQAIGTQEALEAIQKWKAGSKGS